MRTRAVLAALLFLLLALFIPATTAAYGVTHIEVGGHDTITASITNPLNIPDVLRVKFDGEALSKGLIDISLPRENPDTTCYPEDNSCRIKLEPGEQQDLEFQLEGKRAGRDQFDVTVSSANTGKRAKASKLVVVRGNPFEGLMDFVVRILGTT